jgi:NAD(P)-dependent dehydrogenase (short-subunit alcohol dehydrogenase family)
VAFQIDISDEAKVAAMMQFAVDTYGKLSVLNNNAGPVALLAAHDHELVNLDGDVWDKAFSIQLKGTMLCCKHAIPHLLRNGGGSIINISSTAGPELWRHVMVRTVSVVTRFCPASSIRRLLSECRKAPAEQ